MNNKWTIVLICTLLTAVTVMMGCGVGAGSSTCGKRGLPLRCGT